MSRVSSKFFIHLFAGVLIAVNGFTAEKSPPAAPDKVVARVNATAILQKNLDREVGTMVPSSYYHASLSEEKLKPIREKAIEKLINRELIYQYAKSKGFVPSTSVIDDEERKNIKSYGGEIRYKQLLAKNNLSVEEYRRELSVELAMNKLYEKQIQVRLNDADLREYYDANRGKFKEPEKIHLMMIYVQRNPQEKNSAQAAKKKAQEALDKLNKGVKFELVAEEYSNAMSRVKGGDMGFIHKGVLDNEEVEKIAFGMKPGELSKVIQTEMGCFILLVKGKKEPTQIPFPDIKEKLKKELTENREKERMDTLIDSLKKQAKITK